MLYNDCFFSSVFFFNIKNQEYENTKNILKNKQSMSGAKKNKSLSTLYINSDNKTLKHY